MFWLALAWQTPATPRPALRVALVAAAPTPPPPADDAKPPEPAPPPAPETLAEAETPPVAPTEPLPAAAAPVPPPEAAAPAPPPPKPHVALARHPHHAGPPPARPAQVPPARPGPSKPGVAVYTVVVDGAGRIRDIAVALSSGEPSLDEAGKGIIRENMAAEPPRASRDGGDGVYTVTLRFSSDPK